MLTLKDCLDFCDLSEDEIRAIAEHEHIPELLAAELGDCLLRSDMGTWLINRYIVEDIEHATAQGDTAKAAKLIHVLQNFQSSHPTYDLSTAAR